MASILGFQTQIASVMELFANAAVAEICKLVEVSYNELQTEVLKSQKENNILKRKLKLIEVRESFYKRAHKLKGTHKSDGLLKADGCSKGSGRMVQVKISSADHGRATEDLKPPKVQKCLVENIEDGEPDVLIIKEEMVDNMRGKELDLEMSLGVEQERHYTGAENREKSREQNKQLCQQECDEETHDFLKEEDLEEHVVEEDKTTEIFNGNLPKEGGSAAEAETDLHATANASWDSSRYEAATHSLSYSSTDCNTGTSINEYFMHGDTEDSACPFGTQISNSTLSDVDGTFVHGDELSGVEKVSSHSEVMPFTPVFAPQMTERFVCKYCGKPFPHPSALILHQRVHTGEKPYCCTLCGKRFSQSSSLKKHHGIHRGEKPFRCLHCGKQFSDQSNLKKHVNVHTGEKPYACTQCGKTFNQSSNLKTHMKIHTRVQPFGCERCGQIFAYKNSLLKHQQRNCLSNQNLVGQF